MHPPGPAGNAVRTGLRPPRPSLQAARDGPLPSSSRGTIPPLRALRLAGTPPSVFRDSRWLVGSGFDAFMLCVRPTSHHLILTIHGTLPAFAVSHILAFYPSNSRALRAPEGIRNKLIARRYDGNDLTMIVQACDWPHTFLR